MTVLPGAALFSAGQIVNTPLTPNCCAETRATFDLNDSTWVTFRTGTLPLWRVLLSVASQDVMLEESVTALGITLREGLETTFNPIGGVGGTYTVLLNGVIVDSGTTYRIEGAQLGTFSRAPAMKRAVQSLNSTRSTAQLGG